VPPGFKVVTPIGIEAPVSPLVPGTLSHTHPSFTLEQKPSATGTSLEIRSTNPELKYVQICISHGFSLLRQVDYWTIADDYCFTHSAGQPFKYFQRHAIPSTGVLKVAYPSTEPHVVYAIGLLCELNCGYVAAHTQSIVVQQQVPEEHFLRVVVTMSEDSSIKPPYYTGYAWNVAENERFVSVQLCVLEPPTVDTLWARWDCSRGGEATVPQNGIQPLLSARHEAYGGVAPLSNRPHWVKALGIRADGTPVESPLVLITP
ncbi:MAG: hypothetical protein AAB538_00090, partial [Patescibacteria group bacterium]